jgi:hypothetical protein
VQPAVVQALQSLPLVSVINNIVQVLVDQVVAEPGATSCRVLQEFLVKVPMVDHLLVWKVQLVHQANTQVRVAVEELETELHLHAPRAVMVEAENYLSSTRITTEVAVVVHSAVQLLHWDAVIPHQAVVDLLLMQALQCQEL